MTPSPAAALRRSLAPVAGAHVLVVDDEPQIRDILAAVLAREGYRVTSRGDRAGGARTTSPPGSRRVELLVTDLKMPEMSGLELIREAKRLVARRSARS